jgi:hypothetical protein
MDGVSLARVEPHLAAAHHDHLIVATGFDVRMDDCVTRQDPFQPVQ